MKSIITIILSLYALISFSQGTDKHYVESIKRWQEERVASLKSENGWLNLAGLFRLKEGENTFGSAKSNAIVFPKGDALLGKLNLKNGEVSVKIAPQAAVYQGDKKVKTLKVFTKDEAPVVLRHQSLRWFIIKRGKDYYIRLRDLESPNVTQFPGIETFPIDPKWRIEATLEPAAPDFKIPIADVLGNSYLEPCPGAFVFEIQGKSYRLYPTVEGEELFFVFGDATNGDSTYGAGRFLYASKPDANGKIILDFNKAYNPPCAFTAFATCPLPAAMNQLPIEITAGEKAFGEH